jgi:membrane protease YdiL (CAAX protease family)
VPAAPPPPDEPARPRRSRAEILTLYGITLLVTVGLTWLQGSVGWLRAWLLVFVAGTFLYLPIEVLHRRGADPADFGIKRGGLGRQLRLALLVIVVTFPPYLVGFHIWQTAVLGNTFQPESARFDRWEAPVEDAPRVLTLREGEVRLFTESTRADAPLVLTWKLPAGQAFVARLESDAPVQVLDGHRYAQAIGDGEVLRVAGRTAGRVRIRAPGTVLEVRVDAGGDRLPAERLRLGTALIPAESNPLQLDRTLWWLLNLVLVQLLLVALPEEVFYRGYLQTALDDRIGRDRTVFGVPFNVRSALITSALFAIGHYLVIPAPARLAVFFPSLLFGWMRRATGAVTAAVVYHAACNILVDVAARFYAP